MKFDIIDFHHHSFSFSAVQGIGQDYNYADPLTKKIEPKSMHCEEYEESVFCCGIYKK